MVYTNGMERYTTAYWLALLPALLLFIMWLPGVGVRLNADMLLHAGLSGAWGFVASILYLFVFNTIETRRHQKIFLLLSVFAAPFIAYGVLLGGLTGTGGIAIMSGIPLGILLLFGGGVLYQVDGMRMRAYVAVAVFLISLLVAVWFVQQNLRQYAVETCQQNLLGVWDAAEKRCDVDPEQEVRNAIFFSHARLSSGVSVAFEEVGTDQTVHHEAGDLLARVYTAGSDTGAARYRTELARTVGSFVVVPVHLEQENHWYMFSLRKGGRGELVHALEISGEVTRSTVSGDLLDITVLDSNGVERDEQFRVDESGVFGDV